MTLNPLDKEVQKHNWCEERVKEAYIKNPLLNHLYSSMDRFGCDVTADFYSCRPCEIPVEGFYDRSVGVVICENHQSTKERLESVMLHETLHAFDTCNGIIDPQDCVHVACSEIRANSLSTQCNWKNERQRGNYRLFRQHQTCVRRRAIQSLQSMPKCAVDPEGFVDKAWKSCYNDTEPFGFKATTLNGK